MGENLVWKIYNKINGISNANDKIKIVHNAPPNLFVHVDKSDLLKYKLRLCLICSIKLVLQYEHNYFLSLVQYVTYLLMNCQFI